MKQEKQKPKKSKIYEVYEDLTQSITPACSGDECKLKKEGVEIKIAPDHYFNITYKNGEYKIEEVSYHVSSTVSSSGAGVKKYFDKKSKVIEYTKNRLLQTRAKRTEVSKFNEYYIIWQKANLDLEEPIVFNGGRKIGEENGIFFNNDTIYLYRLKPTPAQLISQKVTKSELPDEILSKITARNI